MVSNTPGRSLPAKDWPFKRRLVYFMLRQNEQPPIKIKPKAAGSLQMINAAPVGNRNKMPIYMTDITTYRK